MLLRRILQRVFNEFRVLCRPDLVPETQTNVSKRGLVGELVLKRPQFTERIYEADWVSRSRVGALAKWADDRN